MKMYFANKDSEICHEESYFRGIMKLNNLSAAIVYKAVKERIIGAFWCKEFEKWGENDGMTCGKICSKYSPRNGKSGICRRWSNINYEPGEEVILKLKE
jgi:hypothetical protein